MGVVQVNGYIAEMNYLVGAGEKWALGESWDYMGPGWVSGWGYAAKVLPPRGGVIIYQRVDLRRITIALGVIASAAMRSLDIDRAIVAGNVMGNKYPAIL
jgi:hypothetical protein